MLFSVVCFCYPPIGITKVNMQVEGEPAKNVEPRVERTNQYSLNLKLFRWSAMYDVHDGLNISSLIFQAVEDHIFLPTLFTPPASKQEN